jgi:hypothetical protein
MTVIDTSVGVDEDEWDDTGKQQVFQLLGMDTKDVVTDEHTTATSLCVPVEMSGVSVGYALVDQGANRSLIRQSAFNKHKLNEVVTLNPVSNYFVSTASNDLVPIIGRFMTNITINDAAFNEDSVVYVVDDSQKDISCDVVIGRHTIARSRCRLIDTLAARLCSHRDRNEFIQCVSCKPCRRDDGKCDLQATAAHVYANKHSAAVMKIEVVKQGRRPRSSNSLISIITQAAEARQA